METLDLLFGKDIDKEIAKLDAETDGQRIQELQTVKQQRSQGREADIGRLQRENDYFSALLPTTLTVEEIKVALSEVKDQLMAAKGGAAVGLAMKFLKPKGLKILGDDVKKAVDELKQ